MSTRNLLTAATSTALLAACATLQAPTPFTPEAAKTAAAKYDARVIRDRYGVPHIYGKRHADVAFGLAYAHAEDDWKNIEEVVRSNRGTLAEIVGESGAKGDDFILSLGNTYVIERDYDRKATPAAKAIAEGYAAGLNLWCAENPQTGCARTMPVRGVDIVSGYANRPPTFYGLDGEIDALVSGRANLDMSTRQALINAPDDIELGSNALAVAPSRAADRHTRLAVNSHQPYEGRVAWYEARLKSDEGVDMIGGVFPGSPLILHGAGPKLGWAATVNRPDLFDTFKLTVDDENNPTKYRMDGKWKDLTRRAIRYNVLKDGALVATERMGYWSEHGPAFITPKGVFAVSFSGAGEFHYLDQYLAMNTAKTIDDWRAAQIRYNAIPSVNYVVADSQGGIAYFWNARMPKRVEGWDRTKVLPGDISETLWQGFESPTKLPAVVRPKSGYVVNANHTPYLASSAEDSPKEKDYPKSFGVDPQLTNRGLRAQELYGQDTSITREEFIAYKMDHHYSMDSNIHAMVEQLEAAGPGNDPEMKAAIDLVVSWDGSADMNNRAAPLAILSGQRAMGGQINTETTLAKKQEALKITAALLKQRYGRIDPMWSEVSRVKRGDKSWPTNGGPDTLRAVYAGGDLAKDPFLAGRAGDTYIVIADWAPDGSYTLDTIHQYGVATIDASSPHYGDQAPLFAEEKFKRAPMKLEEVLAQATRDYRPGKTR